MTARPKDDAPTEDDKDFRFGVVFGGKYPNQAAADEAFGKIEQLLIMDYGFVEVRGGGRQSDTALCGCDEASECNERPGCVFTSEEDDDE